MGFSKLVQGHLVIMGLDLGLNLKRKIYKKTRFWFWFGKREIFKEREQKMVEEMTFQSRKYDDLLEQSFYMVGIIEKVIAKAKKISKEFNVA